VTCTCLCVTHSLSWGIGLVGVLGLKGCEVSRGNWTGILELAFLVDIVVSKWVMSAPVGSISPWGYISHWRQLYIQWGSPSSSSLTLRQLMPWYHWSRRVCSWRVFVFITAGIVNVRIMYLIAAVVKGRKSVYRKRWKMPKTRDAPIRQWPIIGRPIIGV